MKSDLEKENLGYQIAKLSTEEENQIRVLEEELDCTLIAYKRNTTER
jgi:hypothetical protein